MCNNRFTIGVIRWKILQETFKERLSCSVFLFVKCSACKACIFNSILENGIKKFRRIIKLRIMMSQLRIVKEEAKTAKILNDKINIEKGSCKQK